MSKRSNEAGFKQTQYNCECNSESVLPHWVYDVWLGQLDNDGPAPQLVTGVARVPVVVPGVPIYQGVPTPAHSFYHTSTCPYSGYIFRGN